MVTGASKEVTVGCEPRVKVIIAESSGGTLWIRVQPVDAGQTDLDAVFFDFTDTGVLNSLGTWQPDPITSVTYDPAGGIDALTNGATLKDSYDARIEFGTGDTGVDGTVENGQFTFWVHSDDGPLTVDSIDHDSLAVVVNSGTQGLVLTTGADGAGDQVPVVKELTEDFDDIRHAEDSALIASDDKWKVWNDQLLTNGRKDGKLAFEALESAGPVTLSFDARTPDASKFEAGGRFGDSFAVEVRIDGGDWIVLDTFEVNHAGTALVGSQTGQTITHDSATLSYAGGALDTVEETAEFRFVSDITAGNERIMIDDVAFTYTELEEDNDGKTTTETVVAQHIDFDDVHRADQEDAVQDDDHWGVRHDMAFTQGGRDGSLTLEEVATDGPVTLSFDAMAQNIHEFEAGDSWMSDSLFVQVKIDGGDWVTLDEFQVNHAGDALVGSETGQEITADKGTLTYSGALLDSASESVQARFVSDISYCNERIFIDDVKVTVTEETVAEPGDCADCEDFEAAEAGDTVADQFDGFAVVGARNGGDPDQNDAMIFDTANPTGQDDDLGYADQGNAIILSEDNDAADPDDAARGGTLTFAFDSPSDVESLTLLDIEEDGGSIDLFDGDGALIDSKLIPGVGNNSVQDIDIGATGVSSMVVTLVGSGAVDDLCYKPSVEDTCSDLQYLLDHAVTHPVDDIVDDTVEADVLLAEIA